MSGLLQASSSSAHSMLSAPGLLAILLLDAHGKLSVQVFDYSQEHTTPPSLPLTLSESARAAHAAWDQSVPDALAFVVCFLTGEELDDTKPPEFVCLRSKADALK